MFTVSIVTKTHNRLSYVLDCIASVQKLQNGPYEHEIDWEHVIYDDGSTDGTQDHFKSHTYPHTRYIRSDIQQRIPKGANSVLRTCTSDYIFELDDDDIVPQRILFNFVQTLRHSPNTGWIITDFYRMNERMEYVIGRDYYGWVYTDTHEVLRDIFSGNHFMQHNMLYRKDMWDRAGGYDESLSMAEDLDLYVRFLLAGQMPLYVPYISHLHRNHQGNTSREAQHGSDLEKIYDKYSAQLAILGIHKSTN